MSTRQHQDMCQFPVSPWQKKIQACAKAKIRGDDKCAMTLTLAKTLSGDVTYTGKTSCSLPTTEFPEGFLLGFKKSHWSNEEETLRLLKVISP